MIIFVQVLGMVSCSQNPDHPVRIQTQINTFSLHREVGLYRLPLYKVLQAGWVRTV